VKVVLFLLLTIPALPGCTSHRLRTSIVNQTSTLTELQYQQVLGNLAMLSVDPDALPAHANLRDGSAQIQDNGQAALGGILTHTSEALPTVSGSRTVVEQWGVTPVTDTIELQLLRIAYRRALGIDDHLQYDLADDLAHELCKQISQADDIDIRSDPALNVEVLKALLAKDPPESSPAGKLPETDVPRKGDVPGSVDKYLLGNLLNNRDLVFRVNGLADALSYCRINSNDPRIFDQREWRTPTNPTMPGINPTTYLVPVRDDFKEWAPDWPPDIKFLPVTATAVVREARRQVIKINEDLDKIYGGWFCVGGKHDIPPDACYVGRYKDRFAWVCPAGRERLADFTLKALDLSSTIKDQTFLTVPGGPRFTPSTGGR
jgi:hypothetical protein